MIVKRKKKNDRPYVLQADRGLPPVERTVWHLKYLSADSHMAILDIESTQGVGSGHLLRLREGLVGWENLRDDSGALIPFAVDEENKIKKELLDVIAETEGGMLALYELARSIRDLSTWTPDAEKNLDSAHSSSQGSLNNSTAKDAPETKS